MKLHVDGVKMSLTLGIAMAGLLISPLAFAQMNINEEAPLVVPIPESTLTGESFTDITVSEEGDIIVTQGVRGTSEDVDSEVQVMVDDDLDSVYQYETDEHIYFYGFNLPADEKPLATADASEMSDVDVVYSMDTTGWSGEGELMFEQGVRGIDPDMLIPVENYEIITKRQIENVD